MPRKKSFRLGLDKPKSKSKLQSMRFDKKFTKDYDEVKLYLRKNNLVDKVIKFKEDKNFIYIKFASSCKFKKNLFLYFTDINNTRIIRGILKD